MVVGLLQFHYHASSANLNKVLATVNCCWQASRSAFKQVCVACDDNGGKPTHLEALHALKAKIMREHMCDGHAHHPRAVERREELNCESENMMNLLLLQDQKMLSIDWAFTNEWQKCIGRQLE